MVFFKGFGDGGSEVFFGDDFFAGERGFGVF